MGYYIKDGEYFIEGIVFELDKPNKNGIIYGKDVVESSLTETKEKIKNNCFIGVFNNINDINNSDKIDIDLSSHIVLDVSIIDESLYSKVKILDTPSGRNLKDIIDSFNVSIKNGLTLSQDIHFNAVGTGRVDNNVVVEFKLISINLVLSDRSVDEI